MRLHAQPGSKDARLSAAEAYTRIAASYDDSVAGDAWMRRALHAHYARVFRPGERVLDVGCGTGLDTVFLARQGVRVVGVDVSPGMLDQARRNVALAGVQSLVELRVCDAAALDSLNFPEGELDGAISGFAALNTLPDLGLFAMALERVVRPRGRLILHMLNRFSSWEFLGACARRDWHAMRLTGRPSRPFTIGGQPVPHRMYHWRTACAAFEAHHFKVRRVYGLGALRPPHTVRRLPPSVVAVLEWLDLRLGGLPLLRAAGRFFVLDLERCATPG